MIEQAEQGYLNCLSDFEVVVKRSVALRYAEMITDLLFALSFFFCFIVLTSYSLSQIMGMYTKKTWLSWDQGGADLFFFDKKLSNSTILVSK